MKMPFKDLLSKEGKKILSRYEKQTKSTVDGVDTLIAEVNGRMKTIRKYGEATYILGSDDKRSEAYAYVQYVRTDIGTAFDRKVAYIQQRIKEIEDGIHVLINSESISLLISNFEKGIINESLVRCINYLRASQSKIDGSRVMLFNYTETILQNISQGSTHLTFIYDADAKEMHMMVGHHQENTAAVITDKHSTDSGANESTTDATEPETEDVSEDSGSEHETDKESEIVG